MGNGSIGSNMFHGSSDSLLNIQKSLVDKGYELFGNEDILFTYTFGNFFHPFVGDLIEKLNKSSLSGMMDPNFHEELADEYGEFFDNYYKTPQNDKDFGDQYQNIDQLVKVVPPRKEIELDAKGPYANYNWELLFHIPLTIAVHLSKNQRFSEAQRWFHYIFDPTCNDTNVPFPQRFWKFLAFRQNKKMSISQIDELLVILSKSKNQLSEEEKIQRESLLNGYDAIRKNPFQPHTVARTRQLAYQYSVVMKYLDNLIAWGDHLFRQDTMETINEATQRYVLAANILGTRPQAIPARGNTRPFSFHDLRNNLDVMGNALIELEGKFPFNLLTSVGQVKIDSGSLFGIGRTLYFCIPRNEKMLSYWDTVADRLFKIRHCMNIEGVVRQLPLFQPPIDPGMLVKAAAAGIDISSLVSGLNQPLAPVRSPLLIQKAIEICNEVRSLGNALLSALEKQDGEALGLLRQKHEQNIQQLAQFVRRMQWMEAESATESLLRGRESALERFLFYQRLFGAKDEDLTDVTNFNLERKDLTEDNFEEIYDELVGQYDQDVKREEYPDLKVFYDGKLYLNSNEDDELNERLTTARDNALEASIVEATKLGVVFIPDGETKAAFWGIGFDFSIPGGTAITNSIDAAAKILQMKSVWEQNQANIASRTATYERRADDWRLQNNLAARELMHIGRQIISSLIREQITRHEFETLKKQIEHIQEIDQFLQDKFTNEHLYNWMQGELSKLYYEYYKFAFDIARKAEQMMKHELMRPELDDVDFIKFNYWDSGRKGLLSGEALHLDLKRMEMAYHDHNKREYELTKHVSLRQLDPFALLELKANGSCEVMLPEWLFDLDCPGHYMRRIKQVSLSIPSVSGPYTSVNCTLSLMRSSLRKSPVLTDGEYARQGSEDGRFVDYYGTVQSIVTSSGQNDSGLFEPNLRDERFLPFEGSGVESSWRLELPDTFRQFDYNTISDVILHVRYTARQGGAQLKKTAISHLEALIEEAKAGLTMLFNLKHDFPSEWYQFGEKEDDGFRVVIKRDFFPYFLQGKAIEVKEIELWAIDNKKQKLKDPRIITPAEVNKDNLAEKINLNNPDEPAEISLPKDESVLKKDNESEVFLLIRYSF